MEFGADLLGEGHMSVMIRALLDLFDIGSKRSRISRRDASSLTDSPFKNDH